MQASTAARSSELGSPVGRARLRLPSAPVLRQLPRPGFWGWTLLAVGLALVLRAPWFQAPLGNDEGGLTYIAAHWHGGGPELYGHYFVDRPPLLLAVFRIAAEAGGAAAVRVIGGLASVLLVVLTALIGRSVGGPRAGVLAGGAAAILSSSIFLGSVFTPAELLAVGPSAASVLLVIAAHRSQHRTPLLFFAGLLAACALLLKQSFGDALFAGLVYLAASAYLDRGNRLRWVKPAAAFAGGIAVVIVGLDVFEAIDQVPDGATSYALLGFRIDGLSALAGSSGGLLERFTDRLLLSLLGSGLAILLIWSLPGLRSLRCDRPMQLTLGAWGVAGVAGVMLGGSYWSHYLIQLIPFATVVGGLALARGGRVPVRLTVAALMAASLAGTIAGPSRSDVLSSSLRAETIGRFIEARAHPGDTIYVRYSQPNIDYYSGLRTPYPYEWSLMLRAIPDAQRRLRTMLRSSNRPTWIVAWEASTAYGLDTDGRTRRLIHHHYRAAGSVDGTAVLLARGAHRHA